MVDAMCELAKIYRSLDEKVAHSGDPTSYEVELHSEIHDYFDQIAYTKASKIVRSRSPVPALRRFLKGAKNKNSSPSGYLFDMDDGGHWFTDNHLAVITYADISNYKQKESFSGSIPDLHRIFLSDTRYDDFAYVSLFDLCAHELVYPVDPANGLSYAEHVKLHSNQGKAYGVDRSHLLFLMEFWHVDELKIYFSTKEALPAYIPSPFSADKAVLGICHLDFCPTFLSKPL